MPLAPEQLKQLDQLEAARHLVLADSALYSQIVQGILPIVGAHAHLEFRRWGAEFLAETFASPLLAPQQKESLSVVVLQTVKELLEQAEQDNSVVKALIQAAASIYPLIFRYIISNTYDSSVWERMVAIKMNILQRWDTAAAGIQVCCIKFVQRIVQVQTSGVIADPRVGVPNNCNARAMSSQLIVHQRPDQNEISLSLVPRDHPLIPPSRLEPEAHGLLDRLLNIFHEDPSDAITVNATLNCLGMTIRTRPNMSSRIISAILNFNPLKRANSPLNPTIKVQVKSMERTTRGLLMNIVRRNENGPFVGKIKQYVDRLAQTRFDVFDEGNRKRPLPNEPTDGLDNAKRMRLGAELPERSDYPPLPPGPVSFAQLFTLTDDRGLTSFDVTQLPIDLVVKITLPVLHRIEQPLLDEAIKGVRARYLSLREAQPVQSQPTVLGDDEDDYEPNFEPNDEYGINNTNKMTVEHSAVIPHDIALGPFKLRQPPPLTPEEISAVGKTTINRVFGVMNVLEAPSTIKKQRTGINRLAGSNYDREAWITVITRLATRAPGLFDYDGADYENDDSKVALTKRPSPPSLSDYIRDTLWKYVIEDFRSRISVAISWLNEEWFNDRIQAQAFLEVSEDKSRPTKHYEKWTLKLLDSIVPFLDAKDKVLIRFLSEIPEISRNVIDRVKGLAKDPERITLAVNALHYLILVRPPVRDLCIDAIEELWRKYDDSKGPATKILSKWRPEVLAIGSGSTTVRSSASITKSPTPADSKSQVPSSSLDSKAIPPNSDAVAAAG
ncbi:MAG: hypothetical protein LQ351_005937 [Letrouitia transgressa]|nr:MAG: hypothetical protein LQ351_005937 [Letrouitia transgressa]